MVRNGVLLVALGLVAGTALAGGSTTAGAEVSVTIPALTRLVRPGTPEAGRELVVSVEVPQPGAGGGRFLELEKAVVLVVQSNVPWTLVARPADRPLPGVVEVRAGRGAYRPVRPEGLVLARGAPGVHQVLLDYRVPLDGGSRWSGGHVLTLVYVVEG